MAPPASKEQRRARRGTVNKKKRSNNNSVVVVLTKFGKTSLADLKKHVKETVKTGHGAISMSAGKGTVSFRVRADAELAVKALDGSEVGGHTLAATLPGGGGGPKTAAELDAEMDAYMSGVPLQKTKDGQTAKDLDAEIDAYMAGKKPEDEARDALDAELDAYRENKDENAKEGEVPAAETAAK
ncbi:hypothetical protein CTAYLR_001687 [Chrysophaeum taylorii]|uniref:Chromatin target of PRMT1 protein C-terminal domain-containing protein n=1 Tax=Chrysophaeum taylorii TaxID=2483200 RepID=A0AAD7U5F0_9STRA|nr:hypothetical protein CTAYLR_001687 [Chrysophaeum taylorii]